MEDLLVDGEIDIEKLLNMTTELMVIEVVNRIFISLFEVSVGDKMMMMMMMFI